MIIFVRLSDLFGWKNPTSLFYDFTLTHAGRTYQSKGNFVIYDLEDGELSEFVSAVITGLGDELAESAEDVTGRSLAEMLGGSPIDPLSIIESPAVLNCGVVLLHNAISSATGAEYKPDIELSPAHLTDWLTVQFHLLSARVLEDFHRASIDHDLRSRRN
jgi:hypothetical protein